MPRYTPVTLPQGSTLHSAQQQQPQQAPPPQAKTLDSLEAGVVLGQAVRDEHGREGMRAYVRALNPLLPRARVEELAKMWGVEAPPHAPPVMPGNHSEPAAPPPQKPPHKEQPAIPPELLMQLLQGMGSSGGGGGGLDPSMLIRLMQNK